MQRSPAEPKPAFTAASAASSRSASGSTTMWFFAPPSACTRLPAAVPRWCTYRATGVEPTNETAFTDGWSSSASTASLSPLTTFRTPSGRPASANHSASSSAALGSFSLGFSTTALPQATATGTNQSGTIAGKLNGEITATTPSGCRRLYESTSVETFSLNPPRSAEGIPQAYSMTSRPRCTSPAASASTLPCSAVITSASRSRRAWTSSRKAKSAAVRFASDASRQARAARSAACTATATSAAQASSTVPVRRPVAGSNTSPRRSDEPPNR
jgi:hypothetical protein